MSVSPRAGASVTLPSPAKVNLFLAVTGQRGDGFHNLVSVVAQTDFGDTLIVSTVSEETEGTASRLSISGAPDLKADADNLVLRAAEAFRAHPKTPGALGFRFALEKRIPMGAGFGGGSSNAATALRGMNQLAGTPLADAELAELAATLGSDCPLFLHPEPVIMRGRGEKIETLPESVRSVLRGLPVLLFKPAFSVATPWAYQSLATTGAYTTVDDAEDQLRKWLAEPQTGLAAILHNDFEGPVCRKFPSLRLVLDTVSAQDGTRALLSGSGAGCFALPVSTAVSFEPLQEIVSDAWGAEAFCILTQLR